MKNERLGWIPLETGLTELTEEERKRYDFTLEEKKSLERRLVDLDNAQLNDGFRWKR